MTKFLYREEITKEMYKDLPSIIHRQLYSKGKFPWDLFISFLSWKFGAKAPNSCELQLYLQFIWHSFPADYDKEIYIEHVHVDNIKYLIKLAEIDFIDSRLMAAIVKVQRIYRQRHPNRKYQGQLIDYSRGHCLNSINKISEQQLLLFKHDEIIEESFMKYNRHLIPKVILNFKRRGGYFINYPLERYINNMGIYPEMLVNIQKLRMLLTEVRKKYTIDDEVCEKLSEILNLIAINTHQLPRNSTRDALKFVKFVCSDRTALLKSGHSDYITSNCKSLSLVNYIIDDAKMDGTLKNEYVSYVTYNQQYLDFRDGP